MHAQKQKPMQLFAHGKNGQWHGSRARGPNDDDGGVAQDGCHTPNIKQVDRDMQHCFTVYFFDIGHPCYDQLTSVKNKVSTDQYHETISRAQVYSSSRSSVFFEVDR